MTYTVNDNYHNLIIRLKTDSASPTDYQLKVYKNGSSSATSTINATTDTEYENTIYFTVPLSSYTIGDELSFTVSKTGSISLSNLNEGLTWLIDGEEVATTHTNTYTTRFDDSSKEHTIQCIYKGNDTLKMSYTPLKTFKVNQPVESSSQEPPLSGQYNLSFVDLPTSFKYNDGKAITMKLTRGGVAVANKTVEKVTPNGIGSQDTNKKGIVQFKNKNYNAGKYKIGGYFYDYDNYSNGKRIQKYKTITIKKNDVNITMPDGNITKNNYATFYFRGVDGKRLVGEKVIIYINGKKGTYTTNKNGNVNIKRTKVANENYKVVFKGNKNYNKKTVKFKRKVVNG